MSGGKTVGIIGAGAWGTALAAVAARRGHAVRLWAREPEVADAINARRENPLFLPGIPLPAGIRAGTDFAILEEACAILVVTPAQFMRPVLAAAVGAVEEGVPLVLCAKGIERTTGKLMSTVAAETAPGRPVAVLSGPTFAHEVARGLPAAVTIASAEPGLAERLAHLLGQPNFRPYTSGDVIGAQIGGAVKNVIAIACGVVDGLGLGQNARAALIARGLKEMIRFGRSRGARMETMIGLSGAGDLVLTCTSVASRNMSLGRALGEGRRLEDVLAERRSVAEGVWTAEILARLAQEEGIDMPITQAVHALVGRGEAVGDVVDRLLSRPFTSEEEDRIHALSRDRS
ncbi:MAG: NAD(P)-dependent glycerol-3-phosphate dehydrogenase [Alphaproteobacteria bacterium]|nr:MAG: NAD(P)-dependent glycerol-3-phosphate dehydrogenase [Alphaproteobacteria bacterium]